MAFSKTSGFLLVLLLVFGFITSKAQNASTPESFVPESWNVHFQTTFFPMYHGTVPALYPGNPGVGSLVDSPELNASLTSTLYTARRLWKDGALYVDLEMAAGSGFSNVTGMAGFPNGEIYRVSSADPKVIFARYYLKQVLGLGGEQENIKGDEDQLAEKIDISRVTLTVGRFALVDFFDNNTYSHDPRSQFTNWAMWANGAWDYAADTPGYTWGIYFELNQKDWAVRLASTLEELYPNTSTMDPNIAKAQGNQVEFEYRYAVENHPGKVRLQAYLNDADMGNFSQALALAAQTGTTPDITQTRSYSAKYGFGINAEQEVGEDLGLFTRLGWNDGQHEVWSFTAIDQTAQLGFLLSGNRWGRPQDQFGLGGVINGLSSQHQAYLAAGGVDFIIGDGQLNYAPEKILETFYNFHPIKEVGLTLDFQWVTNPAYNQDRGPLGIVGGRCHFEI
ncbi:MAG TPA: carbohydrate porin [bacterium]|nr:carbohydrate porin [bacterium]